MELKTIKYLLRLEKRGANIPFDPTSSLYRICPQCSDEFHNTIKKNARIAKKQKQEESEKALNEISQQLDNEEKNIQILDQLDVKENGSQFNMDFLSSIGFDFFSLLQHLSLLVVVDFN